MQRSDAIERAYWDGERKMRPSLMLPKRTLPRINGLFHQLHQALRWQIRNQKTARIPNAGAEGFRGEEAAACG